MDSTKPTPDPSLFALQPRLRVRDLKGVLGDGLFVRTDASVPLERTFLDTFDWRLHAAGSALEKRVVAHSAHLIWQPLSGEDPHGTTPVDQEPRFAEDLPAGPMREALAPVLGCRALLPRARLTGRQRVVRVLNRAGETAVRLEIRKERSRGRGREAVLASLRVVPTPGQEALAWQIRERLIARFGLQPPAVGHVAAAIEAGGAGPTAQSSKVQLPLEPSMPAEQVTKAILRALLGTMKVNVPGIRSNVDSEFLHDFRVAVRRSRAALTQLRRTLPPPIVEHYRAELTWLGQITSPARDLDVYLLAFDDCRGALPKELQEPFEPLRPLLHEARDNEYAVLRQALRGNRFRRLVRRLSRFLDGETPADKAGIDSGRPIGSVARGRILRLYLTALDQGSAIDAQSDPDQLHELRKTCKKLRYLMEFFSPLFPEAEILALVGVLKTFQDTLGEIQDLRVQLDSLGRFARRVQTDNRAHPRTTEAIARLIDHQSQRQQAARADFAARFASFAAADNRERFHTLFGTQPLSTGTRPRA